jgi:hypothetical protein
VIVAEARSPLPKTGGYLGTEALIGVALIVAGFAMRRSRRTA